MKESRLASFGVTQQDLVFLERSRKGLKQASKVGWCLIALSVLGALLVAANLDRLLSASGLEAISTSAIKKLQAANDRLRALQTTTALEEELAKTLMEQNAKLERLLQFQVISAMVLVVGLFVGGLLVEGVQLVVHTIGIRRYARVIDTIERNSRRDALGKTGEASSE